jgi:hypothetical protein
MNEEIRGYPTPIPAATRNSAWSRSAAALPERIERIEELRIDCEDVILSGEYESRGGDLVKVRDLNEPLGDS